MFQTDLRKIFSALKNAGYTIHAPVNPVRNHARAGAPEGLGRAISNGVKTPDGIFIREITNEKEADYSGKCPWDSWKRLFYPPNETLFAGKGGMKEVKTGYPKIAVWGINVIDLKAVGLMDLIFARDPYYIERRKNIFIVGFSPKPIKDYQNFSFKIHNDTMEHLNYDLFILKKEAGFKLYSASNDADKLLKKAGVKADVLLTPGDLVVEDKIISELEGVVGKSFDHPVWKTLNDRCIACGKCSIACPTCYCFDLVDTASADGNSRERVWGDCFYSEFTRIAGNYIFLKNPGEKLFFWYTHKFSRVPAQVGFPGCVGCRRCYDVCPVFIDIEETLADLKTNEAEKSKR